MANSAAAVIELMDRADEQEEEDTPVIEKFQLVMSENPMIPVSGKEHAHERMADDEEIARRDRGDLCLETIQMYEFAPLIHTIGGTFSPDVRDRPQNLREVLELLYKQLGTFPDEWTRYLAVDPSHTRSAVLFGVVPPPEMYGLSTGNCIIIEDELVMKRASARMLAAEVAQKMRSRNYEAFIMDRRMGRQTRVGTEGSTVYQAYADEFRKAGCVSRLTKSYFVPGCDKPQDRWEAVRRLLAGDDGQPRLYVVADKTLFTQKEFRSYRKKQKFEDGQTMVVDEPSRPRAHDCMAAIEYLCAYLQDMFTAGMAYVPSQVYVGRGSQAYQFAQRIKTGKAFQPKQDYVHLGAGSAA